MILFFLKKLKILMKQRKENKKRIIQKKDEDLKKSTTKRAVNPSTGIRSVIITLSALSNGNTPKAQCMKVKDSVHKRITNEIKWRL